MLTHGFNWNSLIQLTGNSHRRRWLASSGHWCPTFMLLQPKLSRKLSTPLWRCRLNFYRHASPTFWTPTGTDLESSAIFGWIFHPRHWYSTDNALSPGATCRTLNTILPYCEDSAVLWSFFRIAKTLPCCEDSAVLRWICRIVSPNIERWSAVLWCFFCIAKTLRVVKTLPYWDESAVLSALTSRAYCVQNHFFGILLQYIQSSFLYYSGPDRLCPIFPFHLRETAISTQFSLAGNHSLSTGG